VNTNTHFCCAKWINTIPTTSRLKNADYVQGQGASRWKSGAYMGSMWAFWRGSQHLNWTL